MSFPQGFADVAWHSSVVARSIQTMLVPGSSTSIGRFSQCPSRRAPTKSSPWWTICWRSIRRTFPQICDLILFEVFTKRKEARGWLRRIFPQSDLPARVEAVRKFIAAFVAMGACPGYVFDAVVTAGKPITAEPKAKTHEPPPTAPAAAEAKPEQAQAPAEPNAAEAAASGNPENKPEQETT